MAIWERWENHYKNLGIDAKAICKDGIINVEKYKNAPVKALFVLKEVNDFGGGCLPTMLKDGPKYQMWNTVARWAAGILNSFPDFDTLDSALIAESLKQVATVNLKKISGKASASAPVINAYAQQDRSLLLEQIDVINPDIIIACGTIGPLSVLLGVKVTTGNPIKDQKRGAWIVPLRHPNRANNRKTYQELKTLLGKTKNGSL